MRDFGYYADFVVFPFVLAALSLGARRYGGFAHPWQAAAAMGAGLFVWTFIEYMIHRFILHNGLIFSRDHKAHHADPKALIGTPAWLTLLIMVTCIYPPAILILQWGYGLVFSFGLTLGYLVYSFTHYSLHQWNLKAGGLFAPWKRIHALHHYANQNGNFGVTSNLWDHVFGTAWRRKSRSKQEAAF